jgi:hypothetical protein
MKEAIKIGTNVGMVLGGISMLKGGAQNVTPQAFAAGVVMGGIGGAFTGASLGMLHKSVKKLSDTTPSKKGTLMELF